MTDSILRSYQYSSGTIIVPAVLRLNLVDKSQAIDDAYWSKINLTITADSLTAPDGTATAEKATQTAVSNDLNALLKVFMGAPFTTSVYLKAVTTAQWVRLVHSDGTGNSARAWFDILNGTVGTTAVAGTWTIGSSSIQAAAGGWYRCIVTFTPVSSTVNDIFTELATTDGDGSVTGSASGTEYGVWGWQFQAGSGATEYQAVL